MLTIDNNPYSQRTVGVSDLAHQDAPDRDAPDLISSTDEYARRFDGPVGEYFLQVQRETVGRMLPESAEHVLDVGGGHGQLVGAMVDRGIDVTVFATNDCCRPRLDRLVGAENYQLRTGDLLDLPLDDKKFDVVLAFRLLSHLDRWEQFLGEICRIAKQAVIFDYPDFRSVNRFSNHMFAIKQGIEKNTARRFRCFHNRQLVAALHSQSFQVSSIYRQFLFPMALHRGMGIALISRMIEAIARVTGLTSVFGSPVIVKAVPA